MLRDLGDGLILRRATAADAEALAAFNGKIHGNTHTGEPDAGVAAWTRDLMERPHPTFAAGDFTLVEDARTGAVVSSLNLIGQTWSYGGIPFGVGRPEIVGTHPDYRRRGLVRAQFDLIHQWSRDRGHKMQAITGIPWYYRQFGYEMALALAGGRIGWRPQVPRLGEGAAEPYRVRPASEADIPFLARVYERGAARSLVACTRDEAMWRYELHGRSRENANHRDIRVIETAGGEPVGFLAHASRLWGQSLAVTAYELKAAVSWLAVTPGVLRCLQATGEEYAKRDDRSVWEEYAFWLGAEHPVYEAIPERLPRTRPPYAWYLRVPDLPDFLRHVAPVLERRLERSVAAGHTGELKISFYRDGLRLALEEGRVAALEPWAPADGGRADASFPDHTFLQPLVRLPRVRRDQVRLRGLLGAQRRGAGAARRAVSQAGIRRMARLLTIPRNRWGVDEPFCQE